MECGPESRWELESSGFRQDSPSSITSRTWELPRRHRCLCRCGQRHDLRLEPLLGHGLVAAGVDHDGAVVFVIGACCDQGELSLRGTVKNQRMMGQWHESYVGGGRTGRFTLTKEP